jgi:hypothetical protein
MAAIKILTDQAMATEGIFYSDEMESISNLDIQGIPSAGSTGTVRNTVMRKTTNGEYRVALDSDGEALQFTTNGATNAGLNLIGVNAAKLKVKVEILGGSTGTYNLEYESI